MTRPPATRADPADAAAFRAAREACRRAGGDYYAASAFLSPAKRNALHAVYSFCDMIRDAIASADDGAYVGAAATRHRPLGVARPLPNVAAGHSAGGSGSCCSSGPIEQRLSLLRERVDDLYDGTLELPAAAGRSREQHVLHAFALTASRYQIPKQYLLDFAEGCAMDAAVSRYATWSSLRRHCRATGGSLALVATCVLGVTSSGAAEHAIAAGVALRLTSILCNLRDDVAAGRVYLPLEDLAACRYTERELAGGVVNDGFRRLMRIEVGRARELYRDAAEGLCWVAGDGSRLAAATLLTWQAALLDRIAGDCDGVFSRRPALTKGDKLRRLPLAWRLARRRSGRRLPDLFPASCPRPSGRAR